MQKQIIIVLLSLIYIVNGDYSNSNSKSNSYCKRFENRIYQLTVTFPGKTPFFAAIRLLPNGLFDEIFSIANGDNLAELGLNFALSNRIGYYKCIGKNQMRLTGFGFLYKTPDVLFLSNTGANVMHDYYFTFSNYDKSINGKINFAAFTSGTNPFTTTDTPVAIGDIGTVKGERLQFRPYFTDLTPN